jgi:hypothetical protein
MTTTAQVLDGLTEEQRQVLGQMAADAIAAREPSGDCSDCEPDGALCADHEADLARADGYHRTASVLGLDLDQAVALAASGPATPHQIDGQYRPEPGEAFAGHGHEHNRTADREAGQ